MSGVLRRDSEICRNETNFILIILYVSLETAEIVMNVDMLINIIIMLIQVSQTSKTRKKYDQVS